MPGAVDTVRAYHERTKHQPHRYARSLGYLDWDTQPDPFRRFEGAELLPLDQVPPAAGPSFDEVLAGTLPPCRMNRASVSQLFYDSLSLSAWKQAGRARWSLRVNPSSGNLHPTEGYLLAAAGPFARRRAATDVISCPPAYRTLAGELSADAPSSSHGPQHSVSYSSRFRAVNAKLANHADWRSQADGRFG